MRHMITFAFGAQIVLATLMLTLNLGGLHEPYGFAAFVVWQTSLFFQAGLTLGNLNAIALQPMGHIAGMAASVIGAVSTVLAALIASPIGMMFDGTPRPLVVAVLVMAIIAFALMMAMARAEARRGPYHD
jgi:DHA1 family bicyclomycin/chloramphenicol resistance-like MFS transporter